MKSYYFLFHGDYFHAVTELEQLPEDAECYAKSLLAELYNITDETEAAHKIYKEIYEKDRYYPNIIPAVLHSLRDTDEKEERFLWIKRGLALNPKDPVMVNHLANYYTMAEDYMASANEWKVLYELTDDPFYILLYEINLILSSVDKTQMKHIQAWVDEKVSLYPQYADEIYHGIGNIVFDKVNKEKALLNHSKSLDKMVYKHMVDQFFEIKRYLEENHPRFKPLKPYSLIGCKNEDPFAFIRSKLNEGEVFYRNILAEGCLVHILVSQDKKGDHHSG